MERHSWSNVKSKLASSPTTQLLATIHDLWKLSPQNKDFLETKLRPNSSVDILSKYRVRIRQPFFPERGYGKLNLIDAKSAISEYFKATKDKIGKADLLLYYVECGTEFTVDYGDINENFYNSFQSAFTQFISICDNNPLVITQFASRLTSLKKKTRDIGWGYGDFMFDEISELLAMN